jgi:hypothetical protein
MDYGKIIRDSFALAWRHKTLWILGIFAGFGGGFNTSFNKNDIEALRGGPFGNALGGLGESSSEIWHTLAPYAIGITIFGLIFLAMHCIATPGLIDAVNRITRGGTYKLAESFSTGIDFFWRTLGMLILMIVTFMALIVALVVMVVVSWMAAMPLGVVTLLLAIPIFLSGLAVIGSVYTLGLRAMVVRNVSIGDAIAEGYTLFRAHLGKNIIFLLINIGLAIALAIAVGIATLVVYGPIVVLAYSLGLALWQSFLLAVVLALPLTIPIGGYLGTFQSSMYTIFYFALVEPEGPQYAATTDPAGYEPTV